MASCQPGDTLLLARNCHAAAFSAMVLTGATRQLILLTCCSVLCHARALECAGANGLRTVSSVVLCAVTGSHLQMRGSATIRDSLSEIIHRLLFLMTGSSLV
jgi:hypothetical protein